jgi:hypothetical protein
MVLNCSYHCPKLYPEVCRLLLLALSTLLLHTLTSHKASGLLFDASEALTCVAVRARCLHRIDGLALVLNSRSLPRFVACNVTNSLLQKHQYVMFIVMRHGIVGCVTSAAPLTYCAWLATRPGWFWLLADILLVI